MNPVLTIDPEFEAKCPPLTEDELSQLEENILEEGLVLMPLIVWNDTIVDGHNRYRIAQAHPGIGFRTHEKQFSNRYEALSWICKNQLGRRNLTPQQKKYLIGQRYDAEKKTHGGDRKSNLPESSGQNDHLIPPVTKSVGQSGPLKKPDELSIWDSLPGARVQRCGSPVATSKGRRHFEAPTEPTGETSSLKGVKGERLAQ